jgi:hypothetical protein
VATAALEHSLPWYFGVAVVGVWATLIVALLALFRYTRRARAERRALERRDRQPPPVIPDDRSIGPGSDLEVW